MSLLNGEKSERKDDEEQDVMVVTNETNRAATLHIPSDKGVVLVPKHGSKRKERQNYDHDKNRSGTLGESGSQKKKRNKTK